MYILLFLQFIITPLNDDYRIPINASNRQVTDEMSLTRIGQFGLLRKARPSVPAHLHTGIDIKRPSGNYQNEPIYSITRGTVISIRSDGPYAQIIIEHQQDRKLFWTLYEHIAGINVELYDRVGPEVPIARFMNKMELDRYGWQFDHFHFEILKKAPIPIRPDEKHPQRFFASYTLQCFDEQDLKENFYDPIQFLDESF